LTDQASEAVAAMAMAAAMSWADAPGVDRAFGR
jgi:hypothetical protein